MSFLLIFRKSKCQSLEFGCMCACSYCYLIQITMTQIQLSLTTFYSIMSFRMSFRGFPIGQMYCAECLGNAADLSLHCIFVLKKKFTLEIWDWDTSFKTGCFWSCSLPLFVVDVSPSMKANKKTEHYLQLYCVFLCGSIYKDTVLLWSPFLMFTWNAFTKY